MQNELFYKRKASVWEQALPVGNGRLGAMVFGNLKKERISLNEDSLWSGYPKDLNKKDAAEHLGEIRQAIFEQDREKAAKIANEDMHGHWSEAYLPFGELVIDYASCAFASSYERRLNLENGICTARNSNVCETVFASFPAGLIAVNIKSEKGVSFKVSLKSKLKYESRTVEDSLVMYGSAPEICMPPYYNTGTVFDYGKNAMKFCAAVKVLGTAKFSDSEIIVENQKETTLLISLATSFKDYKSLPDGDAQAKAFSYFENIKPYEELLSEHKRDFSSLFNRVSVDFGSEKADMPTDKRLRAFRHGSDDNNLIALVFQYGRYLTISSSRQGTNASTLQGIFNEHVRAPWSSSYTLNINTEMNYWCCDICNLSECFEPFISLAKKLVDNGKTTARDYYNCSGSCAHHNSDIWGATYPAGDPLGQTNAESYACWQSTLPWMLNQIAEHYRYTESGEIPADVKEMFSQVLDFYNDFLIEKDGALVTCPTISPENTYIDKSGNKACLTYMPTMDIGILSEFFANCRYLGFDTPQIPDIPIGKDGRINEWAEEFGESEPTHRHVSHLYCIYPCAIQQSEEVKKAAEKSLLARGFGGTGWSLGWKVCLWARLGNAENALKLIKNQLVPIPARIKRGAHGGSYPNLFDAHPPFQIDGNFGVTAGIAEMLKNGAIPESWSGYAKGIKLHGAKTLNIKFENGKIIK